MTGEVDMSLTRPVQPPAILLLAASEGQAMRIIADVPLPHPPFLIVTRLTDVPTKVEPGTRVHVMAGWPRNESIIGKLHHLHRRYGLIDPTGLLGVDTSPTQSPEMIAKRAVTDSVPIGLNLKGNRERPPKRAAQPTSRYNN